MYVIAGTPKNEDMHIIISNRNDTDVSFVFLFCVFMSIRVNMCQSKNLF